MRQRGVAVAVVWTVLFPLVAFAQSGGAFRSVSVAPSSGTPVGMVAGLFDGDTLIDAVTAESSTRTITPFTQYDVGQFSAGAGVDVGVVPAGIADGDFDEDGCRDVAVSNGNNASVSFVRGTCDGNFDPPGPAIEVAQDPAGIVAIDFDGDHHLDLVVAGEGSSGASDGRVSVLKGDGHGGFLNIGQLLAQAGTHAVAVGDVNNDTRLDIVALNSGSSSVSVFLGNPAGTFSPATNFRIGTGQREPQGLALGFLNADTALDIVTADKNADAVSVLLGDGHGNFAASVAYAAGSQPRAVTIADVDGDDHADVVSCNEQSTDVTILRGDGSGGLRPGRSFVVDGQPVALALADLDATGGPDVITANVTGAEGSLAALLNGGNGSLQGVEDVAAGDGPSGVTAGDIDGDGLPDLIVTHDDGTLFLFLASASGGFGVPTTIALGGHSRSPVAADLDGDGRLDIAVVDKDSNRVLILLGRQGGTFAQVAPVATATAPSAVQAGDLNGDGRMDLVVSALGPPGQLSVFLGHGDGTFGARIRTDVGDGPGNLALGDVNGDGKLDIAVVNTSSNDASVLVGKGDGTFESKALLQAQSPSSVAIGYLDADGLPDIVVGNSNTSSRLNNIFHGNGDGTFVAISQTRGDQIEGLALRDFTGDTKADIVAFLARDLNAAWVLRNGGQGSFQVLGGSSANVSRMPVAVVAADFDGDGRYDAATANNQPLANNVSVLSNCVGQFDCAKVDGPAAVRGEANGDGAITAADLVAVGLEVADADGSEVENIGRAGYHAAAGVDANGDGHVDTMDRRAVAHRIFSGGEAS